MNVPTKKGKRPDYDVSAVAEIDTAEGKKTIWTRVGVAFVKDKSIQVLLNALPVNGKLVLMEPKEQQEKL